MKFLRDLILEGRIPHFRVIKLIALILSFLPIPIFFLTNVSPKEFGELGWQVLIGIMLIRPLADVLPGLKILHSLVPFRKEFGILSAWLLILHGYGIFAANGKIVFLEIFDPQYWKLSYPLMWGMMGFIAAIILLVTSNNLSLRILRNNWKRIQRLSYPLFFFSAVHIALVSGEWEEVILPILAVVIFWSLAQLKIKVPLFTGPPDQIK